MRSNLASLIKELDECEDPKLFVEDLKTNNFFLEIKRKISKLEKSSDELNKDY